MKTKTIISVLTLVLVLGLYSKPTFAEAPERTLKDFSIPELVSYWANYYQIDYKTFNAVGKCESGWNEDVVGDNKRAYNVLQIHRETFEGWSKEMGEELDYGSTMDHIKVGAWAFAHGESYKNQWTTYRALKHGGTYAFYSSQLKKHYVVHCNY